MIDWSSKESSLLLNPRMSGEEALKVRETWKLVAPNYPAHLGLLTSGSSGRAKLVLISKHAMLEAAAGANEHLVSGRSDTWLKTIPEFHVGGLSIYARAYLSGARVIEAAKWSVEDVYSQLSAEKATLISLVPTQLYDFIQRKLPVPPTLRAAIIGGGALAEEYYLAARQLDWPVLPSYGMTECGSQVATALPDELVNDDPSLVLLPHINAQVSESGHLMIKSSALLSAYVDIETGNIAEPKVDGWFTAEDLAELHGRRLKVLGRSQDFLKIGGESVDFAALLKKFDSVWASLGLRGDAALIPIPDDRLGTTINLLASALTNDQVERLVKSFNETVMPYERIRKVKNVAEIPRSELGKILRSHAVKAYLSLP